MNRAKDMLKAGKTVVGTGGSSSSEVQLLADSGLDFLLFDTQHSPVEIKQLLSPIRSMRRSDAIPIIRVGENGANQICYALDVGAKGIVVPMVNTGQQAADMVQFCKYPFNGIRSSAGMRGEWGEFNNYREYMDAVNEQLLVIPMVETVEAMDNLDEILSVPGIDVLLIGPSDLSINLGLPLDYTNPKYHAALDKVVAACQKVGVAPGMYFVPEGIPANELIEKGFRFFTLPWAPWATEGIQNGLAGIKRS